MATTSGPEFNALVYIIWRLMSKHILLSINAGRLLNDFHTVTRLFLNVTGMVTFVTSLVDINNIY